MENKRTLLIMQRKILSDAFVEFAKTEARLEIKVEQNYALAALASESFAPRVIMIEIPEAGLWKYAEKCLSLCDVIKKLLPGCKIIILCSEIDLDSCKKIILAKRENRIDDFLFYESSLKYLFSKLESFSM